VQLLRRPCRSLQDVHKLNVQRGDGDFSENKVSSKDNGPQKQGTLLTLLISEVNVPNFNFA
jgi:hypothetical protein